MAKAPRSVWVVMVICCVFLASFAILTKHYVGKKAAPHEPQVQDVARARPKGQTDDSMRKIAVPPENASEEEPCLIPSSKIAFSIPVEVSLKLSKEPHLGEVVRLIFELTPSEDIPKMIVEFHLLKGVEVVGGAPVIHSSAGKDERKEFAIKLKFVSSPVHLGVKARGTAITAKGERFPLRTGGSLRRVIVDEKTGRFGGAEELFKDPWWNYDPLSGEDIRVSPAEAERNRKWIEEMRGVETSITDWEALYLCRDAMMCSPESSEESLRVNKKRGWERIPEKGKILLENGWLQEFRKSPRTDIRTITRDKPDLRRKLEEHLEWLKRLRKEGGRKGERERSGKGETVAPVTAIDTPTQFTGSWVYQKYPYDTSGIDSVPLEVAVAKATVAIWGRPEGYPGLSILGRCLTDDNGDFDINVDLQSGSLWVIREVLYPIGPNSTDAGLSCLKTSDPNGPYLGWRVPEDIAIWSFTGDSMFWNVTPGIPHDFGKVYVDTLNGGETPWSASVNIYQTFLQAYDYLVPTYTSPEDIGRVTALWEPGHSVSTGYLNDTIRVFCDTSDQGDTDEWDDMVLLHEYGHHVMKHCAEIPPGVLNPHYWWKSHPEDSLNAYREGWPTLLARVVTDSVFWVDTKGGIGGKDILGYFNTEDPWDHSDSAANPFEGGPWCEGAVAGILGDIFDTADEDSYHIYPAPGWPDTGLADTLSLGFAEIWDVSSTYDPAFGSPERCWTIYHFLTGWTSPPYNYDHKEGFAQILTHHRVPWNIPPTPSTLKAILTGIKNVFLTWLPGALSGDPLGYNIYRREMGSSEFVMIGSAESTLFTDTTALSCSTYVYTATALDSLQVESDTSNNVTVWIPGSDDSLATARNNAQKIVWDQGDSTVYIAFSSGGNVCCEKSTNFGGIWSVDTVGQGAYPTIAFDPDGDLWMVWMGDYGSDAHMAAYRGILCSRRSSGSWSTPETLGTYLFTMDAAATQSESLQCVSFSADSTDTGHVAVTYKRLVIQPDTIATWYHYLDYITFETDTPVTSLSPLRVDEGNIGNPIGQSTIAADSHGVPHLAWEWKDLPTHRIRYAYGPMFLVDTVPCSLNSYRPYIEYNRDCNRIGLVWEADTGGVHEIYSRFMGQLGWLDIKKVSSTGSDSRLPAISGSYALWSEWESGVAKRILRSKYSGLSESWAPADTVFRSDSASLYAHTLNVPDSLLLFSCWTKDHSGSYCIAFDLDTSAGAGGAPSYYVDAGRPFPSPYLRHRSGFDGWGDLPELTVDTDPSSVSYSFGELDPSASYELRTVHYFESSERALVGSRITSGQIGSTHGPSRPLVGVGYTTRQAKAVGRSISSTENLAVESNANFAPVGVHDKTSDKPVFETMSRDIASRTQDPWMVGIRIDGHSTGTLELPPESVKTFRCEVPQELTNDGTLTLDISRLKGDVALVSEIYLYPVQNMVKPVNTGAQMSLGVKRNRFRFHNLAPNPSRGEAMVSYELTRPCNVEIAVFDVAGRLVTKVSRLGQSPGVHSITWGSAADIETQDVATGAYFVRLIAKNAVSGAEEFSATRKLLVVR